MDKEYMLEFSYELADKELGDLFYYLFHLVL